MLKREAETKLVVGSSREKKEQKDKRGGERKEPIFSLCYLDSVVGGGVVEKNTSIYSFFL